MRSPLVRMTTISIKAFGHPVRGHEPAAHLVRLRQRQRTAARADTDGVIDGLHAGGSQ